MNAKFPGDERTGSVRIVIADDHAMVRDGLRTMLEDEPGLEVVGEASNGREAVELSGQVHPEVVLMDVRMPDMDGLEATRAIKRNHPLVGVLMVTMHDDPDYLLEALSAGAAGYILKGSPGTRLIDAIRRTVRGESPLNQELAVQVLRQLADQRLTGETPPHPEPQWQEDPPPPVVEPLTPREVEVLGLLARGQSNPQIAQTLTISKATAKVHVERIIRKLEVSDRTQAAVRAINLGLLENDSI